MKSLQDSSIHKTNKKTTPVSTMDRYFEKRKIVVDDPLTTKLYCDASRKEEVMVAAYIAHNAYATKTRVKQVKGETAIDGEIAALVMALEYIQQYHIKCAIIYTELIDVIHASKYLVVLHKTSPKQIPKQYQELAKRHASFWRFYRYVYQRSECIFLEKVDSQMNPAHSIACRKRDEIMKSSLNSKLRNWIYRLGVFLQRWGESK